MSSRPPDLALIACVLCHATQPSGITNQLQLKKPGELPQLGSTSVRTVNFAHIALDQTDLLAKFSGPDAEKAATENGSGLIFEIR